MKNFKILLLAFFILPLLTFSQKEKDSIKEKLERPAFESSFIIDNPTNVLFNKNALEVTMQHRFGNIKEGNTLAGIYGDGSNIRIAFSYSIHERLTIGYGTTKNDRLQDFNWKVGILRQTRSNKVPVSVSYYGNFTIDARKSKQVFCCTTQILKFSSVSNSQAF